MRISAPKELGKQIESLLNLKKNKNKEGHLYMFTKVNSTVEGKSKW